jgi:copper(I)-binding protein
MIHMALGKLPRRLAAVATVTCLALGPAAAGAGVTITNAWVRGTVAPQTATGAFMEIRSTESVSLVGVSTPAAKSAAVHEMSMDGGVMRMRPVEKLDLEADKAVALAPGGYHLMLEGLKKPLHKGESVPLSLVFEGKDGKRFSVEAKAKVLGLTEAAPPAMAPTPRP